MKNKLASLFIALSCITAPQAGAQETQICEDHVANASQYTAHDGFLGHAVSDSPITLIGDTNHANPNLLAFLADEQIVEQWADEGVSDVYLEINRDFHAVIDALIQPNDLQEDEIRDAFLDYFQGRFYNAEGYAELRTHYYSSFVIHAAKNGIHFHFISQNPPELEENPDMAHLFQEYSALFSESCSLQEKRALKKRFMDGLDDNVADEFKSFLTSLVRNRLARDWQRADLIQTLHHGGKRVVVFGNAHFASNNLRSDQNIAGLLGHDATTHIELVSNPRSRITSADIQYDMRGKTAFIRAQ